MSVPLHPASHELALLAHCGELAIAIEARTIHQMRRAAELPSFRDGELLYVDLDGELVPAWDLGELLGLGTATAAWVIADLPTPVSRRVAFRVGRCVSVRALPRCEPVPARACPARAGAIAAAFVATDLAELADVATAVVIDLARVLGPAELATLAGQAATLGVGRGADPAG